MMTDETTWEEMSEKAHKLWVKAMMKEWKRYHPEYKPGKCKTPLNELIHYIESEFYTYRQFAQSGDALAVEITRVLHNILTVAKQIRKDSPPW